MMEPMRSLLASLRFFHPCILAALTAGVACGSPDTLLDSGTAAGSGGAVGAASGGGNTSAGGMNTSTAGVGGASGGSPPTGVPHGRQAPHVAAAHAQIQLPWMKARDVRFCSRA